MNKPVNYRADNKYIDKINTYLSILSLITLLIYLWVKNDYYFIMAISIWLVNLFISSFKIK